MEEDLLGLEMPEIKTQLNQITNPSQNNKFNTKNIYDFSTEELPKVIAKRVQKLVQILNSQVVNLTRLKQCLAEGIPDEARILRQYSWKLVLGYLPPEKDKWEETVAKEEKTYSQLVKHFLPVQKFQDYPLILKKDHPRFKQLQEDFLIWQQIQKDTSRTHAQFSFFATQSHQMMIPYLTSARRQKFKLINGQNQQKYKEFLSDKQKQRKTYRYDYMTRILYIYSRLNPKIQYVQGMNQILAPIFYLLNVNKPHGYIDQAGCFYLFNNAISDIIQLHIKDLDKSENGIYGKLNEVNQMLVVIEPQIWSRLQSLKIDPFFYCFRWVTLLYAQDFNLFDTMRIWQSIFSCEERLKYISYIAIGIIMSNKQTIVNNDFTTVLEHLQNIKQNTNINQVLSYANELYFEFKDKDFTEYARKAKKSIKKKQQKRKINEQKQESEKQENLVQKFSTFFNKLLN